MRKIINGILPIFLATIQTSQLTTIPEYDKPYYVLGYTNQLQFYEPSRWVSNEIGFTKGKVNKNATWWHGTPCPFPDTNGCTTKPGELQIRANDQFFITETPGIFGSCHITVMFMPISRGTVFDECNDVADSFDVLIKQLGNDLINQLSLLMNESIVASKLDFNTGTTSTGVNLVGMHALLNALWKHPSLSSRNNVTLTLIDSQKLYANTPYLPMFNFISDPNPDADAPGISTLAAQVMGSPNTTDELAPSPHIVGALFSSQNISMQAFIQNVAPTRPNRNHDRSHTGEWVVPVENIKYPNRMFDLRTNNPLEVLRLIGRASGLTADPAVVRTQMGRVCGFFYQCLLTATEGPDVFTWRIRQSGLNSPTRSDVTSLNPIFPISRKKIAKLFRHNQILQDPDLIEQLSCGGEAHSSLLHGNQTVVVAPHGKMGLDDYQNGYTFLCPTIGVVGYGITNKNGPHHLITTPHNFKPTEWGYLTPVMADQTIAVPNGRFMYRRPDQTVISEPNYIESNSLSASLIAALVSELLVHLDKKSITTDLVMTLLKQGSIRKAVAQHPDPSSGPGVYIPILHPPCMMAYVLAARLIHGKQEIYNTLGPGRRESFLDGYCDFSSSISSLPVLRTPTSAEPPPTTIGHPIDK